MPQQAALVLRFDVESAAALASPAERTDAAWAVWIEESLAAVRALGAALNDHDAPASFFIVGELLARAGDRYAALLAERPGFDIGNHTFTHMCIVRAEGEQPIEQFRDELRATGALIRRHFGLDPIGFTAPGCFHNGLRGRAEQLRVLWEEGCRHITTSGRAAPDEPRRGPAPIVNPFWYAEDGFPGLLEEPLSGWHCNLLFNSGRQNDGWQPARGFPDGAVLDHLPRTVEEGFAVRLRELEYAVAHGLIYAPAMHPWSVCRFDPDLIHLRRLIDAARHRGLPVLNCRQVYEELRA